MECYKKDKESVKKTFKIGIGLILSFFMVSACERKENLGFNEGDVWRFTNDRPCEGKSTALVCKIVKQEKDTIIHILVDGVRIYDPQDTFKILDNMYLAVYSNVFRNNKTLLIYEKHNIPEGFYKHYAWGLQSNRKAGIKKEIAAPGASIQQEIDFWSKLDLDDAEEKDKELYERMRCDTIARPRKKRW